MGVASGEVGSAYGAGEEGVSGDEEGVFGEITEFEGISFDEAHVQVELENGQHRTFSLHNPEGGHALSQSLDGMLQWDDQGNPIPESLFDALGDVIDALPQ